MNQVIIYKQDNGIPAVVMPTKEALDAHGIMAIAIKDVPAGKKFKIIDAADLPDTPQETWTVKESDLTDGVGGESNELPPEPEQTIEEGEQP
jgi:hypothetical protein